MIFFLPVVASAQYSIHGQVLDEPTNTPLPGASVFIANTTKGASADADGKFEIKDLLNIHYNVVISFVGYEPVVFDVVPGQSIDYKVKLKPAVKLLGEVVVKAKKMPKSQWRQYLNDFKLNFIGLSENAKHCYFENEDVLIFDKEKSVLTATADTTLIMRNDGLGYNVNLLIQKYEFDSKKHSVVFAGQMSFEPLVPIDEKQKRRWAENRLKAYHGSEMHFLRALYNHRLNEEGFYFTFNDAVGMDSLVSLTSPEIYSYKTQVRTLKNYDRLIDTLSNTNEEILRYKEPLTVVYANELEDFLYQKKRGIQVTRVMQTSKLISREPAYVLPDGRVYPIEAAEAQGYWSWELMSESLPLDYDPAVDLKTLGRNH
ncbi:MAG: carboxypeptidase-like regulatory domain-containing protein [Bacteroidota bacterium]